MTTPIPEILITNTKLENLHRVITPENWGVADEFLLDTLVKWFGGLTNMPGNLLTTGDLMSKIVNFNATVGKLAARQARSDTDIDGEFQQAAYRTRYEELVAHAEMDPNDPIALAAVNDAERRSYTNRPDSRVSKGIVDLKFPGVRWVLPLRRAIINAIGFSVERSPLVMWKNNPIPSRTRDILRNGTTAEKDDAWGRIAFGTAIWTIIGTVFWDQLDGEAPRNHQAAEEWRKNGHFPDSLQTPGGSLRFRNMGVLEAPLKATARVKQYLNKAGVNTEDDVVAKTSGLLGNMIFALADSAISDAWPRDIVRGLQAVLSSLDKQSFDPALKYSARKAGTMLVGNLGIELTRALDTGRKYNTQIWDPIISRIPFMSKLVPDRVSVWGDLELLSSEVSPEYADPLTGQDPIYKIWSDIGFKIPDMDRDRGKVRMTPKEFQQFAKYAGKGDGRPESALRYKIERLMSRPEFKDWVYNEKRIVDLREVFEESRDDAMDLLKRDDRFDYGKRVEAQEALDEQLNERRVY